MATFDTIAVVRRLEDAGLSRDAAEAVTAANLEAVDAAREAALAGRDTLATKADLETGLSALKADLETGLSALKADLETGLSALKADLAALETRLTWRVVGIVFAGNAMLAALLGGLVIAMFDRLPT